MNVQKVIRRWVFIGGGALVLLTVLHCFEPLPHLWIAATATSLSSLVISALQEWVEWVLSKGRS